MGCIQCIGGTEVAVLERRYLGNDLDPARSFAFDGEVGIQASYLGPGAHCICWPMVAVAQKFEFLTIPHGTLGIVEAKDGAEMPSGRIFAPDLAGRHHDQFQDAVGFLNNGGVRGKQLRFLTNGQFKMNQLMFRVTLIPVTLIPAGSVGLVVACDGTSLATGALVGRRVDGHDMFQRPEVFLQNGGQKGPQVDFLRPGTYNIHTGIFQVTIVEACKIPEGHIGVVDARGGQPMDPSDVVNDSPAGHGNFQDGEAFLAFGGRRGPQTDILPPGTYYINTMLFEVRLHKQTIVKQGEVAVLISNHGRDPAELVVEGTAVERPGANGGMGAGVGGGKGGDDFDTPDGYNTVSKTPKYDEDESVQKGFALRHVVPTGYRGIQKTVLGPGRYNVNPLVSQVVLFPTTTRSVEWAQHRTAAQREGLFNPFEVVSNDGFAINIEVRCQYRVLPDDAPYVIAKLGSIQELEQNVIDPQIDGIIRAEVSKSPAISYQQKRAEEQAKAEAEVRRDMARYRVQVVSVMITNIHLPMALMETTQKKNLAEQQRSMYDEQQKTELRRIEFEKTSAQASQQASIMEAEAGILIEQHKAAQEAEKAKADRIRIQENAYAEAEKARVVGEAEAIAISARGAAVAESYRLQGLALGPAGCTAVEVVKAIAGAGLAITPEIVVSGGGKDGGADSSQGLVQVLLAEMIQNRQK